MGSSAILNELWDGPGRFWRRACWIYFGLLVATLLLICSTWVLQSFDELQFWLAVCPSTAFALSQLAFVWGARGSENRRRAHSLGILVLMAAIASLLLSSLIWSLALTVIELLDYWGVPGLVESARDLDARWIARMLQLGLACFAVLLFVALRHRRSARPAILVGTVVVSGWIGLSIALPIELALAEVEEGILPGFLFGKMRGSEYGIAVSLVALAWTLGPATYLLGHPRAWARERPASRGASPSGTAEGQP